MCLQFMICVFITLTLCINRTVISHEVRYIISSCIQCLAVNSVVFSSELFLFIKQNL
jgi:hypothetical protein